MGLGFVIGGFCPGTSVCAAAIGKIDAMIFIVGAFFGVIIFAEGYPLFESFYKATNFGNPRFFETLGMSQNIFAFIMVMFALTAFWVGSIVENKVNGVSKPPIRFTPYYIGIASIGILMAFSAFVFPERKAALTQLIEDENFVQSYKIETVTTDEFALCLLKIMECNKFQIFDFRSLEEFKKMSLPKSTFFTLNNLFEKEPSNLLNLKHKINVFVADDELTEKKMAIIAYELGYKRIQIVKGGLNAFKEEILNFQPIINPKTVDEENINRFRSKAKAIIPILIEQNKFSGPVKKTQKRVVGGC